MQLAGGGDEALEARFNALAVEAAVASGLEANRAVWLDKVRRCLQEERSKLLFATKGVYRLKPAESDAAPAESDSGAIIKKVVDASICCCAELESKALAAAQERPQVEPAPVPAVMEEAGRGPTQQPPTQHVNEVAVQPQPGRLERNKRKLRRMPKYRGKLKPAIKEAWSLHGRKSSYQVICREVDEQDVNIDESEYPWPSPRSALRWPGSSKDHRVLRQDQAPNDCCPAAVISRL